MPEKYLIIQNFGMLAIPAHNHELVGQIAMYGRVVEKDWLPEEHQYRYRVKNDTLELEVVDATQVHYPEYISELLKSRAANTALADENEALHERIRHLEQVVTEMTAKSNPPAPVDPFDETLSSVVVDNT